MRFNFITNLTKFARIQNSHCLFFFFFFNYYYFLPIHNTKRTRHPVTINLERLVEFLKPLSIFPSRFRFSHKSCSKFEDGISVVVFGYAGFTSHFNKKHIVCAHICRRRYHYSGTFSYH